MDSAAAAFAAALAGLAGLGAWWFSRRHEGEPAAGQGGGECCGGGLVRTNYRPPAPADGPTQVSAAGLDLIREWEGFRHRPYRDAAGYGTIGYGHLITPGEQWDYITIAEGEDLLREDAAVAVAAVNRLIGVPLTQSQFDALVSFVYNLGAGSLARSTLRRKLNRGDYAGAAAEFGRWIHAGGRVLDGLVARRSAEAALFRSGGLYA